MISNGSEKEILCCGLVMLDWECMINKSLVVEITFGVGDFTLE